MRKALVLMACLALAMSVWAGGTTEQAKTGTATVAGAAKEAPMLAEQVKAGKLPPVEQRLPEHPLVVGQGFLVKSDDLKVEVGKYGGGTLRSVTANPELDWNLRDAAMENWLVSPAHTTGPAAGNVAESFEISPDNKVYTFTIRKGLKWSDGTPVTTEDVRFAVEDVLFNKDLTPALPINYRSGGAADGNPFKLDIVDQYTFRMSFDRPYGWFMVQMGVGALWGGYNETLKPSHVLKPYHIKYAKPDELAAKLKEAGLGDKEWHRLFLQKDIAWSENMRSEAVGFPTLGPWVRVESPQTLMVMERNPYYFKVDTAGQQLPYIDRYESVIVANAENIPLKVISGEVNFNRDLIAHDKVPLLKENEAKGGYKVVTNLVYHNAPVAVFINYLNEDQNWRQVVSNKKFRHAVNMAINYQQIIDTMFLGLGKPNPWTYEGYDPEKAKQLLDEVGLNKKDANGYRIGPNGKTFEFFFEVNEQAADWVRMTELITADLEKVGLRAPMKVIASDLWIVRRDAGQLYATIDWLDDVNWPILKNDFLPYQRCKWGQGWHNWLTTGGKQGEEPPDWMKKLYDLDATFKKERPDSPTAQQAIQEFAALIKDEVPMFPLARDVVGPVIVPPNLGNLATQGKSSATWFAAEQMFFK